ncbi:RND superfamily putative drug exporter [Naumannella cuiyingiana]|uniref:RND superfamily putative drug exporter n=1 Tax=Naumannella cuiyingiana TaxID=1347891 RepID=A0A7Z0IKV3_9ACTN|nr:MMPL family transporter [Naumannella cuiyingiana]NYI70985.1 RND superfamily putative drug exporter [Naumannella cuiyingiana]
MSSYLYALGRFCFHRRGRVLLGWLLALVVLGGVGAAVMRPFDNEFRIPGAESMAALDQLKMTFPEVSGTSATLVVVAAPGADIRDRVYRDAIGDYRESVEDLDFVDSVTDPYDDDIEGLISSDGRAAIVRAQMPIEAEEFTDEQDTALQSALGTVRADLPDGARAELGGEVYSTELPRLSVVELIGLAVALVVLALTLGSLIAAGVPLITAVLGVAISMTLLLVLTALTQVNSSTPMLAVMLGLAVGIDYALFILSRHRDQLARGMDLEESVSRAVATAGSAVVFAGLTVVIALCGLAVANLPFLTVMGGFAAAAVVVAVLIALTLLPALMGFLGERMRPRSGRSRRAAGEPATNGVPATNGAPATTDAAADHGDEAPRGFFRGWVRLVTKVPVLTIALVVLVLGALSLPAGNLQLALPDSGQKNSDAPDKITYDLITEHFGVGYNGPLIVTAEIIGSNDPVALMDDLKADIEKVPGVASVPLSTPNRNADTGFIQIIPTTAPSDPATADLVQRLRGQEGRWLAEYDVQTAVTGTTAAQIDVTERLGAAMVPFGIFVVGLSLILLTMVFRSIVVPIKAAAGFLLSVGAALGATTLVFNEGHLRQLANLEQPGPVISFFPIMLMGILFGLAMDYEVFLVSRMREEYAHGRSARGAIERGFVGSARVVVAAALIMFFVFAFFVPEGDGAIKAIAFGLAVGIFADAFLVRMVLVPAVMALLGDRAWWLPRWLDKLLPSLDVEGERVGEVLRHADWPANPNPWAAYAENFTVGARGELLAPPVDLRIRPGEVLVVEGEPSARTPLLLALSGRMEPVDGRARVAGGLLPGEAGKVRRRTELIDAVHDDSVARALDRAARGDAGVIIVDGADALHSHDERTRLAGLVRRMGAGPEPAGALILGAADAGLLDDLLPGGYHLLTLGPVRPDRLDREPVLAGEGALR